MPGICIFCGKQGGNREHTVGRWMLRDLGLYSQKFKIGFGVQRPDGGMDEIKAPQPLGSFVTDQICAECNNGWMSQLEDAVKPLLTPLLQETLPNDDRPLFQNLFVSSHILTQWLLKTACTFGVKMSVPVAKDIRESLFQKRIPSEITADMSVNDESGLYIGMSRQWSVFKDDKLDCASVGDRSFRFVWQVRHLAMRITHFPGCEKNMSRPRFPVKLYPRFGILPDYTDGLNQKRSYHYETLEQLEHETTYFFGGNPNYVVEASHESPSAGSRSVSGLKPATKSCGSCTLCCKLLAITELKKPPGEWCKHCVERSGCQIYPERPAECREFSCIWLLDPHLGPEWKPERSKFVLAPSRNGAGVDIHCDPAFPKAWRREPYYRLIQEWALAAKEDGGAVMIRTGKETILIAPEGEFPLGDLQDNDRIEIEYSGSRITAVRALKAAPPTQGTCT